MNPREIRTKIVCEAFDTPILLLGRCGEGNATRLIIDVSDWLNGGGTFEILVKRADGELFTAGNVEQGNGVVTWLIAESEIGAPGYGEIELNYTDGSGNIKTARCDTRVFSSMEIDALPPSGTTWSQLVLAAVGDANASASASASGASVAQASAAQAKQAASAAETSKQNAAQSASAASASAQQAAGSAQAAAASAKTASDKAAAASSSESNAANSESAARDSASAAASSATAAQGSATAAASSASSAQTSANSASQNASAALSSKNSATQSATNAAASAQQAAQSQQKAQALFDSFHDKLCNAQIYGTKETASFDAEGRIVQIIHTDNTTGETVRTDVFTYAGSMITETRTLPTGEKQVNVYDMTSFVFQYDVQEGTT